MVKIKKLLKLFITVMIIGLIMINCISSSDNNSGNPNTVNNGLSSYDALFGSWEISWISSIDNTERSEDVIIDETSFSIMYTFGPLTGRRFEMSIDTWTLVNCEVESIKEQVAASYKITGKVKYRDIDGFTALGNPSDILIMYVHIKKGGQGMWRSRFINSAGDGEYNKKIKY